MAESSVTKSQQKKRLRFLVPRQANPHPSGSTTNKHRRHYGRNEDDAYTDQLKAYRRRYGSVGVDPKTFPELARWLTSVRRRRSLPVETRQALQVLGVVWRFPNRDRFDRQWEGMFRELLNYRKVHGNCRVPQYADSKLSTWVKNQRANHKKGLLKKERKQKLDGIGFIWELKTKELGSSPEQESMWMEKYHQLLQFRETHGHCRVPVVYPENQVLGDWVNNQRNFGCQKTLRDDRRKLLDDIGFSWRSAKER